MTQLFIQPKDIVVPGQVLADGLEYLPGFGTFRDKDKIVATRVGLAQIVGRAIKIVPLSGTYNPNKGDVVIGVVVDITIGGWRLDINSAYSAMLSMKDATSEYIQKGADLTRYFTFGDYLVASITNVTSQKLVDLTVKGPGLKKLEEGRIVKVNPNKVPRIIGKNGSMMSLIKEKTNCHIVAGQNGVVWVAGEPEMELLATRAMKLIESQSHVSGLTEKVSELLSQQVR